MGMSDPDAPPQLVTNAEKIANEMRTLLGMLMPIPSVLQEPPAPEFYMKRESAPKKRLLVRRPVAHREPKDEQAKRQKRETSATTAKTGGVWHDVVGIPL